MQPSPHPLCKWAGVANSAYEIKQQKLPLIRKMDVKHSQVTPSYSSQTRLRCRALILRVLLSSRHPRKRKERHLLIHRPALCSRGCWDSNTASIPTAQKAHFGLPGAPFGVGRRPDSLPLNQMLKKKRNQSWRFWWTSPVCAREQRLPNNHDPKRWNAPGCEMAQLPSTPCLCSAVDNSVALN